MDFDEQNHLFYNRLKTDYKVVSFICKCGHTAMITTAKQQDIDHKCELCGNKRFYNANEANIGIGQFLKKYDEREFDFEYEINYSNETAYASCGTTLPYQIDFLNKKILTKKLDIFTFGFDNKGEDFSDYLIGYVPEIFDILEENLYQFIRKNRNLFNIPSDVIKPDIDTAKFFFTFKHFKELEFYYWQDPAPYNIKEITLDKALLMVSNRNEKSIKKAIYESYAYQMQKFKRYNNTIACIICERIDDSNLVIQFLKSDLVLVEFSKTELENIELLIIFLQKHYTDKQILNLLKPISLKSLNLLFIDLLNEFRNAYDNLEQLFIKVTCNIKSLHDHFVQCALDNHKRMIFNEKLNYTLQEYKNCKTINDYEVRLPLNGKDLISWATSLHNCLASYFYDINDKSSIIYGFYREGVIEFAVRIVKGKIIEASRKYNKGLNSKQQEALTLWFDDCYKTI